MRSPWFIAAVGAGVVVWHLNGLAQVAPGQVVPPPGGAPPRQVTPPRALRPGEDPPRGTAIISGTVTAMDSGSPLRRVQVRAFSGRDGRVATTDDQGRFELRELAAGRYTLTATKGGYVTLQYGQQRPSERGTPIEIADGQVVRNLKFALPRGGVIAGRVTDDAGEPLTGVQVQAMRYMFAAGGRRLVPAPGILNRTDDLGAFRVFGLPPGDYYLYATMQPAMGMMIGPGGTPPAGEEQGFAPTYYPGTPSVSDAERVNVGVGQEVTGILFSLAPTRLSRVTGRVIGATGSSNFVMAMPDNGMLGGPSVGGPISADGTFELPRVAPGRYILRVQPRGPDDARIGVTPITVTGTDLSGITITMQPQGTIAGRFEFEGGAPPGLQASQLRVSLVPAAPDGMRFGMGGPPEVAANLTFSARAGIGEVFVRGSGPPGWVMKAVDIDGRDVTDTPVNVAPGTSTSGVRILLTRTTTTLSGTVRDDRGQVVLDTTVVVFPDDDSKWGYLSRYIRTARPDTEGRFEITGLPPASNYRIIAAQAVEDGQTADPEFLVSLAARAEHLGLAEGETKNVDLRLR